MTQLMAEWQKRLGLHDWQLVLCDTATAADLPDKKRGSVEYVESTKQAAVVILGEEEAKDDELFPYDREKTLVHELLHLKFCLLDNCGNDLQERIVHQLVDDLARALVDAKREGGANNAN